MAYEVNQLLIGNVGVEPAIKFIKATDNTLAEVTTAGFIENSSTQGIQLEEGDVVFVKYAVTGGVEMGLFQVSISGGIVSLSQSDADIVSPTITNAIAHATNTSGTLSTAAANVFNLGDIAAGQSGTAGKLISYPATANTGSFNIIGTANSGNFAINLTNAQMGQATTFTINDPGAAAANMVYSTGILTGGNVSYWNSANGNLDDTGIPYLRLLQAGFNIIGNSAHLLYFQTNVLFSDLAAAGTKVLFAAGTITAQYRIMRMEVNVNGTNFSGGDRLINISDGTNVVGTIQAALAQALENASWGVDSTKFAYDATNPVYQVTAPGANIIAVYTGGTTDYTAGSVTISGYVQQVSA